MPVTAPTSIQTRTFIAFNLYRKSSLKGQLPDIDLLRRYNSVTATLLTSLILNIFFLKHFFCFWNMKCYLSVIAHCFVYINLRTMCYTDINLLHFYQFFQQKDFNRTTTILYYYILIVQWPKDTKWSGYCTFNSRYFSDHQVFHCLNAIIELVVSIPILCSYSS